MLTHFQTHRHAKTNQQRMVVAIAAAAAAVAAAATPAAAVARLDHQQKAKRTKVSATCALREHVELR